MEAISKCDPRNLSSYLNEEDSGGFSALHHAAAFDEVNIVEVLLSCPDFNFNKRNHRGASALHAASCSGSMRVIRKLLASEHSQEIIDAQNEWGETALHLAAGAQQTGSVQTLLEAGADPKIKDRWGRCPFRVCVENGGHSATLSALTEAGISIDTDDIKKNMPQRHDPEPRNPALVAEFMDRLRLQSPARIFEPVVKGIYQDPKPANKSRLSDILETSLGSKLPVHAPASAPAPALALAPRSPPPVGSRKKALSKLVEFPGDPIAVAGLLADESVDPCGKDMFGVSALMKFAAWNKVDLLDLLLGRLSSDGRLSQAGAAFLNSISPQDHFTALHHAADMGALRTYNRLLACPEVDSTLRDKLGRTARGIAQERGIGEA